MKVKSFKEFDDDYIIKEFENEDNYDVIGCFKEPDYYSIVGNLDFLMMVMMNLVILIQI